MRCAVACLLLLLGTVPVHAEPCENVVAECAVIDLGGNEYEFVFTLTNGSSESNAIYFWVLDSSNAPLTWETVSWEVPEGWKQPGLPLREEIR